MRMRKKKNLEQRIDSCRELICAEIYEYGEEFDKDKSIIDLGQLFCNSNPVWLEIGCGKGGFVNKMAHLHPEINFIALEKSQNVIVTALEETKASGLHNIRYISGMADYVQRVLGPQSIDGIFLNFSCPFPKKAHTSRRLTHPRFLEIYRDILKEGGFIKQKTDNFDFFNFSIDSFQNNGFLLKNVTFDLHNSSVEGNIKTEYEEFFSNKGFKINFLEAYANINTK